MARRINRQAMQQLMAYSAAAGLGAFGAGQDATAAVVVGNLNLDLAWDTAAHPNPPNGAAGDDFNFINWDAGQPFDAGDDHFINAGKFGVQFAPACDIANIPGCQDSTPGTNGVTSLVFSSQTYLDPPPGGNELKGNAALVDPNGPNAAFYSTQWINNTYYVVGFGPGVQIDGSHKTTGVINFDYYSGFLTMLGASGVGDNDANTHVAQGNFVAFSFEGTDGTHYGWAQMGRQTGPSTFTTAKVHSFAYESTPDTPIFTPILGDTDFDGFVGFADLNVVLGQWNQNVDHGDWTLGDIAGFVQAAGTGRASGASGGDGFVGFEDLNAILGNWNASLPPASGAAVPEPASLVLLSAGLGAIGLRMRRGLR